MKWKTFLGKKTMYDPMNLSADFWRSRWLVDEKWDLSHRNDRRHRTCYLWNSGGFYVCLVFQVV